MKTRELQALQVFAVGIYWIQYGIVQLIQCNIN